MPITRISPPTEVIARIGPPPPGDPQIIIQGASSLARMLDLFLADMVQRLVDVETGAVLGQVFTQAIAAATWTITHNLGTYPNVTVVSPGGDLLFAEVIYPDADTTVIIFGQPYAGTAYLRG